jgi:hypothetical protein
VCEVTKYSITPFDACRHFIPGSTQTLALGHWRTRGTVKQYPEHVEMLSDLVLSNLDELKEPIVVDESEPKVVIEPYVEPIVEDDEKEIVTFNKLPYEIKDINKFLKKAKYNTSNLDMRSIGFIGSGLLNDSVKLGANSDQQGLYSKLQLSEIEAHKRYTIIRDEREKFSMYAAIPHDYILTKNTVPTDFCHEVIHGDMNRKIAFDIDLECSHDESEMIKNDVMDTMRRTIKLTWNKVYISTKYVLTDKDIIFMSSCGPKNDTIYKVSYHILVASTKYMCMNARENEAFAELVRDALPKYKESIDMGLYKSRSNLRILNCYKVEREIVDGLSPYQDNGKVNVTRKKKALFPETLTLSQSLVSYTVGLTLLTIKLAKDKPIFEHKQVDCEYDLDKINSMLSEDDRRSFVFRSSNSNILNYNRISPSYCELCNRTHDKDNTLYIIINNISKVVTKGCIKCSDNKKVLGQYSGNIIENNYVPKTFNENEYNTDDELSEITEEIEDSEYEFEFDDNEDMSEYVADLLTYTPIKNVA